MDDQAVIIGGEAQNARLRGVMGPMLDQCRDWARELPLDPRVDPERRDLAVEAEALYLAIGGVLNVLMNDLADRGISGEDACAIIVHAGKAIGSQFSMQDDALAAAAFEALSDGINEGFRASRAAHAPQGRA